jgi:hypothetical protein
MKDLMSGGYDRRLLIFSLLRRLGRGAGAFLVVYPYFNQNMDTSSALGIGVGAGLVAFCLPPVRGWHRPPPAPRGFEVVVPVEPPGD